MKDDRSRPALIETLQKVDTVDSQMISHYRIIKQLGAGGMGEVYLAEDTKLNRKVAIKFLPRKSLQDEQAKQGFMREAQAAARLDHPNICIIHEEMEKTIVALS